MNSVTRGLKFDIDGKVEEYAKETILGAILQKQNKINNLVNEIHTLHDMEKG